MSEVEDNIINNMLSEDWDLMTNDIFSDEELIDLVMGVTPMGAAGSIKKLKGYTSHFLKKLGYSNRKEFIDALSKLLNPSHPSNVKTTTRSIINPTSEAEKYTLDILKDNFLKNRIDIEDLFRHIDVKNMRVETVTKKKNLRLRINEFLNYLRK